MRRISTLVIVAAFVGLGVWGYFYAQSRGAAPKYRTVRIERGPLTAAVSSTGNLNAVTTVQVGSQVSGQVKDLYADFNTLVKKNQVIARIDPEIFEAEVSSAKSDLDSAQALYDSSVALGDAARAKEQSLSAGIQSAIAQLRVVDAQLLSARAQVDQKKAGLVQAQADLEHTTIRAPVNGVVVSRQVDVGQTVAASLQAPALFTIAEDLTKMQVEGSVAAADVGRVG